MYFDNYYLIMIFLIFLMMFIFMKNFLMLLISMEYLLVFYLFMMLVVSVELFFDWMFLYLLVMGVCESVIGITLMISLVHNYGNQNMKILNLSW